MMIATSFSWWSPPPKDNHIQPALAGFSEAMSAG